jgi:glyoxylase-like metal-dependent hydrolase (beta-lactamase superfamily II)/8-oxo-dGTP pyrophosphatase MutT (NUDIX family)
VSDIAAAASVLLARGPGSPEVFLVRRASTLRFMGGFHAFPGGKVHSTDATLAASCPGLSPQHVAAVRELFEETGVLLARRPNGSYPASDAALAAHRQDLLSDRLKFDSLLNLHDIQIRKEDLLPVGSLVTPAFSPVRFDTAFFVATLPPGQTAQVWPGELDAGEWSSSEAILSSWTRGSLLVSPPSVALLEGIRGLPVEDWPARLAGLQDTQASAIPPIWFAPATLMIPLRCQGLPPSTHTNAFLIGTGPVYLLDPGPTDPTEQEQLFHLLDSRSASGQRLTAIVLTHHHPDHVGAANVCAQRYQVPILAHARAAEALRGKIEVHQLLDEGAQLDLGPAPHGTGRWHMTALHTPGHAWGHLAFWEPFYGLLFAGDMVSTITSVLIAPSEGDLSVYLDSLRRLQTVSARLLLPAHGSPSARPAVVLAEAIAHRQKREAELLQALGGQPRSSADLAMQIYRGLPAAMMRFAEMQILAGLQKLEREGRVHSTPSGWQIGSS